MNFNKHWELQGEHAFLGASKYSWLNYSPEKLAQVYENYQAKARGTRLHEFASECIKLGQRLPSSKKTLNMFVNDAIGYRMKSEQILYYSDNCFGTADAISFKERNKMLRIHDLKTGVTPASMHQPEIYAALFCLEYDVSPNDIHRELRIYQSDQGLVEEPEAVDILRIMQQIREFDKIIRRIKMEQEELW